MSELSVLSSTEKDAVSARSQDGCGEISTRQHHRGQSGARDSVVVVCVYIYPLPSVVYLSTVSGMVSLECPGYKLVA